MKLGLIGENLGSKRGCGVFGHPCFWAKNVGGFVWGDFSHLGFWAENGGGGFKKVKKLKKNDKKSKKVKKKGQKKEKLKKK